MQKSVLIVRLIAFLSLLLMSIPAASLASDPMAPGLRASEPDFTRRSTHRPRGLSATTSGASNLVLVGQFGGATAAVDVVGDLVYAGIGPRLAIFDLSRPAGPVLLGQTAPLPRVLESLEVHGDYAYVAAGSAGLRIIDVSDPAAPVEVGFAELLYQVWDVAVAGDHAYVANALGGLRVLSVSDPAHPVEVGYANSVDYGNEVAVAGGYVYVADMGGLRTFDLSNPAIPDETWLLDVPGGVRGLAVAPGHAYLTTGAGRLQVADLADPAHPEAAGYCDLGGDLAGIAASGTTAYAAD